MSDALWHLKDMGFTSMDVNLWKGRSHSLPPCKKKEDKVKKLALAEIYESDI
jgi:hypothetical protein